MQNYNGYFNQNTHFDTCHWCQEKAFCFILEIDGNKLAKCRRCLKRQNELAGASKAKFKTFKPQVKGLAFMLNRYNIDAPMGSISQVTGVPMPLLSRVEIAQYCAACCLEFTQDFKKLDEIIDNCVDALERLGYVVRDLRDDAFYAYVKKQATREFYAQRNITSEVPNGL